MRKSAGKTHSGKLTVDEEDTFVCAVGGDKAPFNGKIISANNTYGVGQHCRTNDGSNEKGRPTGGR